MADIISSRVKINDIEVSADAPLTEALMNKVGADINDYLDKALNYEEFLANDTWTAPDQCEWIILHGGGGGAGGRSWPAMGFAGNGGNGAPILTFPITVTPGNAYTITIGAGGAINSAGGNTTFIGADANIIMPGAIAPRYPGPEALATSYVYIGSMTMFATGYGIPNIPQLNGAIGGQAGIDSNTPSFAGQSTQYAAGGTGKPPSPYGAGGGGGAGFTAGGNGATGGVSATIPAANSCAGGGGAVDASFVASAGGSGRLRIYWYGNPA